MSRKARAVLDVSTTGAPFKGGDGTFEASILSIPVNDSVQVIVDKIVNQ